MHGTQQNATSGNFNLFVAPQSSTQSSNNPLFTLEPSATNSPTPVTRSLPMKRRVSISSHLSQGSQETSEHSEKLGVRQETDRVGSLHSKLKQEADKIRKWKTSMEMEVKDKNEHIKEMTSLVEEQRKSLLEVQLEYEKVSGLLQEERGNQDQLGKQLTHTRELFSAVTQHVERVEREVWNSGNDSEDLSSFQDQLKRRYEDLLESFSSLQGRCDMVTGALESELGLSREQCRAAREKNEALLAEVDRLGKEICEKTRLFQESFEKLSSELREKDGSCAELRSEKESLRSQLEDAQLEIETVNERCETLSKSLVERENEISEKILVSEKFQNQCNELMTELEVVRSSRESLESVNLSLRNCVAELEEKGNKLNERLGEAEARADRTVSDLENVVSELSSEKGKNVELRERVSDLEGEKLSLEKDLSSVVEQLDEATLELKQLEERLRDQLKEVQNSLESLGLEKEESKRSFLEEISSLKLEIENVVKEREGAEKMHALTEQLKHSISLDNEAMKLRCEELERLLSGKTEQANSLTSDLEASSSEISCKSVELEKLVRTIEEMGMEKNKLEENHTEEVGLLKSRYSDQLLLHSEEVSNLKAVHQIELESSTENHKLQTATHLEEHGKEMERVLGEKTEKENELHFLKQQISSLKEELSVSQNSAIHINAELRVEKELSEKKVSEMFSSLCKYKQESESIVSANNKQLEEIKLKHSLQLKEEVERASSELNSKLESVMNEKIALEEELSKYKKERDLMPSISETYYNPPQSSNPPKTPRNAVSRALPPQTPKTRSKAPPLDNDETEIEQEQSREVLGERNFRTPSIHACSNLKQKRKKIRLDDVSMEILNSQDDPGSSKGGSLRRKSTKNIQAKENIRPTNTPGRPSKGKESKIRNISRSVTTKTKQSEEYNWFESDMVFGIGADD